MGSSLSAKAGTFAIAATLSGLLALGTAPLAGAAESSGNSGSTPAAENANGGNRTNTPAADHADGRGGEAATAPESTSDRGNTPPGNNTTIKIHRVGTSPDDNRNEPHISCEDFLVDFYGYDGGDQSTTMTFQLWAPTKGGSWTLDGNNSFGKDLTWTTGERTSGNQPDHEIRFSPDELLTNTNGSSVEPAKQGYHVKLTVHVTGSRGADVKHKVFWIEPCTNEVGSATETTVENETSGSVHTESVGTAPFEAAKNEVATAVLGEHFTRQGGPAVAARTAANATPQSPPEVQVMGVHYSRSALATTGAAIATLAGLGLALLAAGWALTRSARRRSEA